MSEILLLLAAISGAPSGLLLLMVTCKCSHLIGEIRHATTILPEVSCSKQLIGS